MRLSIKQIKLSNLYSFLSHLSQWNELVCVPSRKREWLRRTGILLPYEQQALLRFSKILQEAKNNLEPIFLFGSPKKIWTLVSQEVGFKNAKDLQKVFNLFKNRFEKIWEIDEKRLKRITQKFRERIQEINEHAYFIERLCGVMNAQRDYLVEFRPLLSSSKTDEYWAWSLDNTIVLECSGYPLKKIDELIFNIFLHEYFHICFQKNKSIHSRFRSMIKKQATHIQHPQLKQYTTKLIFEEALISSFLPEGYFGAKNLNLNCRATAQKELKKKNNNTFTKLRYFCALKMYDLAKSYIEKGMVLDEIYFRAIIRHTKEFLKNVKGS